MIKRGSVRKMLRNRPIVSRKSIFCLKLKWKKFFWISNFYFLIIFQKKKIFKIFFTKISRRVSELYLLLQDFLKSSTSEAKNASHSHAIFIFYSFINRNQRPFFYKTIFFTSSVEYMLISHTWTFIFCKIYWAKLI